jgi:hypothetical protein
MHTLHFVLRPMAWLIALAWVYKLAEAALGLPRVPNLLEVEFDRAPANGPSLLVIVPARNEAAKVSACLESLLGQDYQAMRIIAVDDRSTDATGTILDKLAEGHGSRMEVMHVAELPAGWLGKTHAMAMAARQAMKDVAVEYLLFTDADVIFEKDAVRRSLVWVERERADHAVVLPTTIVQSWGEGMLLVFLKVTSLWAMRPWRVGDADARDAIGVGAFNLIRVSAYRQVGGFEADKMEIVEDLGLGRRVKRAGLRQRVAAAPGMVSVHWAAGATGIVHGLTKNIFAVFGFRPAMLMASAVGIMLSCIVPAVLLFVPGTRVAAAITLGAVTGLYGLSRRFSRISTWYAVLFPVAATVMVYSMVRSMMVTLRDGGVTWRGTFYPLSELRDEARRRGGL